MGWINEEKKNEKKSRDTAPLGQYSRLKTGFTFLNEFPAFHANSLERDMPMLQSATCQRFGVRYMPMLHMYIQKFE